MATPASIPTNPSRDSVQRIHRITRENRSLWYQLTVLQQPERARACGSGMKANSDRRPVDPPPVVELRIIEGPTVEEGKEITFDYNANFFLYASLEQARTMAHGRVQTPAASNPPILTGVPASGMAYLDRPSEAGYFIFPDLSVRHEGYFRLSFSLFETTKEEKDFDLKPADSDMPPGVDWRMEIKTQPFNVFSAKKFPGLMESTQLSKTVADQGCRVRIRRDVRMRKRDSKSGGYDRRDEEYSRRRTVTPAPDDPHGIRARSLSNSSEHRVPYGADAVRRPSMADPYSLPPPPPGYEQPQPPSRGGHLSFGDASASQYAAPRPYPHPTAMPAPPMSPSGPYPPSSQSPYNYHHGRTSSSAAMSSTCPSPAMSIKQEPYDRSSGSYVPPSPSVYNTADRHARRDSHMSYTAATPILPAPAPRAPTPASSRPHPAPLKIAALMSPLPPIEAQTEPMALPPVLPTGSKRKHDYVFQQSAQPLHHGQRQVDPHLGGHRRITHDQDVEQGMYSRADGKVGVVHFGGWQS
ncbi:red and blue light sensing protein [Purpureocillium lilacinum]|uniref:Red and blue light sensing protein n=2 Tax=Purpureocillium lilacinum TaxID=33203 RepID=A0A179HFI8_PURLI|nr:red and blue light sensing protein [Purpureocillium lilacinum]OAQ88722.1 red and blue light sensing protein [Purpureocillium lilacinum]GJN84666.1 velvet protein [Purpureocillium lilacinum]